MVRHWRFRPHTVGQLLDDLPAFRIASDGSGGVLQATMAVEEGGLDVLAFPRPLGPLAVPLLAKDLAGLPPAYLLAAGEDPLRADAEAFATALAVAGVNTELVVKERLVHGFLRARALSPAAAAAFVKVCAAVQEFMKPRPWWPPHLDS